MSNPAQPQPQPTSWNEIGLLQYCQGQKPQTIKDRFIRNHSNMTLEQKHLIRADILKKSNRQEAIAVTLKYNFKNATYTLKDPNEAVLLKTCRGYHWFSLDEVAQ